MSVREYIGARYIPLFSDPIEWDNTRSYEPLTVVKYQGASYVSRQSVPEGIELTNNNYWLLWADYNAQLEQYRQEVLAFDGRIDSLEEALPISDFDSTNTVDARFDAVTDALEQSVTDIENEIESNKKRKFLILGDSYGAGTARKADDSGYETSQNGWIRYMVNTVAAQANVTVYSALSSIVVGNSGFASTGKYIDVINDLVEREIVPNPEEITDLVVFAGTNDTSFSATTVYNAVISFMTRAKELFPYANVRIGYMSYKKYNDIEQAYRRGCEEYGGEYVYGLNNLFVRREWLSPDGVHPNFNCYDFVRDYIIDAVFNGNITYKYEYQLSVTAPTGYELVNQLFVIHVTENEVIFESRPSAAGGDYPSINPSSLNTSRHEIVLTVDNMPILDYYTTPLFQMYRKFNMNTGSDNVQVYNPCGFGFILSSAPTQLKIGIEALITNTSNVSSFRYLFPVGSTVLLQNFIS